MVRSTLKLNAAISHSKIGGLRSMLAEDPKWGGPGSMVVRSSLKLNASIVDSKIGGLRTMLAEDPKWRGPGR